MCSQTRCGKFRHLVLECAYVTWIHIRCRPLKLVWHGSLPNGERSMDTYCDAWHSSSHEKFGYASNLLGNKLLDQERQPCDGKLIVLCVEALSQDRRKKRDLSSR